MRISTTLVVCGVDEAGRGPLAGPVYAAAVILDRARPIRGLADSKVLSPGRREVLAQAIRKRSLSWAIAAASVEEIDTLNILRASLLAMSRAVAALSVTPDEALVDGNQAPTLAIACRTIIGGDALHRAISAASILAKTARDAELRELDRVYPLYGFAQHKGYGTPQHLLALRMHGPCPIHRRSFSPVAQQVLPFDEDEAADA
ncbi:MAG: ribonuclease HII [Betaproteobacteria bacterium]